MNDQLTFPSVTLTGDLKFRKKNNWFVTGTFCFVTGKNHKLSRALLQICKNCHGHFSFFTGIFWAFLSRATSPFSRAKFGVFCHGHVFKFTGTFSKSVTGKPKIVTGEEKKHCRRIPGKPAVGMFLFRLASFLHDKKPNPLNEVFCFKYAKKSKNKGVAVPHEFLGYPF